MQKSLSYMLGKSSKANIHVCAFVSVCLCVSISSDIKMMDFIEHYL